MAPGLRFGGFGFQVRLVLVLLVLFFAALDLMNLFLLNEARGGLYRAERERLVGQAREAVAGLGIESLVQSLASRGRGARPILTPALLRRRAVSLGLSRLVLLDPAGREVVASAPDARARESRYRDLPADAMAALAAGRVATTELEPAGGGEYAQMTAYVPILDGSGRLVGVAEARQAVPELGHIEARFRLVVGVQVAGMLLIAGLLLLFANWVSRPYRRLAAAAGEAGWSGAASPSVTDPDDLTTAFRAMVSKLREQDHAFESLEREGGGLGVLVRFASNAARTMPTGVLVLDRQARVAAINPAAAALLGCAGTDVAGLELRQLPRAVEGLQRRVRACLERGQGASREVLELRMEDGRPSHLGIGITPAPGRDDEVAGVLVLMSDLTEIRQLQEQARLRENLAAVGQLSAGIAHEFRNALGTILGYAKMLDKQGDAKVRGPVREIVREVNSVRAVVDEFLLYARPPDPARVPLDLGALIRASVAASPESLEVDMRGEFGQAIGDEGLLRRAFGNLLQNAADAAADAGRRIRVQITGRKLEGGRVLQVDLDDDGPGVPAELRSQVFVPFFTTRARGTGLGLALVQRTMVDLGGSVEAGEGPRGGALFRIRIPLVPAPTEAQVPARSV